MRAISWLPMLLLLAPAGARADEWQRSFPLTGRPTLHLETKDGGVRVDSWDQHSVGVRVLTQRWRIPNDLEIQESQRGNQIDLRLVEKHHWVSFGFSLRSIRVEVHVPRDADLDLETGDGAVTVEAVNGRVRLHTGDGSVDARRLQGELDVETGDGRIEVSGVDGRLRAHTGDGRVRIEGRFDGLDLATGDGTLDAVANSGSKLKDDWQIETGDGPVTLRIPHDLDATLDLETHDGRIHLDLPVRVVGTFGNHQIHGDLNRGGATLRVRTGDGSIHIGASG